MPLHNRRLDSGYAATLDLEGTLPTIDLINFGHLMPAANYVELGGWNARLTGAHAWPGNSKSWHAVWVFKMPHTLASAGGRKSVIVIRGRRS